MNIRYCSFILSCSFYQDMQRVSFFNEQGKKVKINMLSNHEALTLHREHEGKPTLLFNAFDLTFFTLRGELAFVLILLTLRGKPLLTLGR